MSSFATKDTKDTKVKAAFTQIFLCVRRVLSGEKH